MTNILEFNDDWLFSKVENTEKVKVSLPRDAMILEKRDPYCKNAHNSGFYPGGEYIYIKKFYIESELRDKLIAINFEGIYCNSKIYVNNSLVYERPNGYVGFSVPINEYLLFGAENEIKVIANNSKTPNSRWYTGSGIYRPVQLIISDKSRITDIKIETLSINPAKIAIKTTHTGGDVHHQVFFKGKKAYETDGDDVVIEIDNAKLWNDEEPNLYELKTVLTFENITDEITTSFGIRKLEWSSKGFFINGKEIKLRGACIHHDNGILGACAFEKAEYRKVKILKSAGFNAIRSSHNPCSTALLKACDKIGMYVIDEFSDVWYKHKQKNDYANDFLKWHKEDLTWVVERGYNHPSVIMYSIGNEIGEVWEEKGVETTKKLVEICKNIDSSRPVTCGTNMMLVGMSKKGIGAFKATDSTQKKATKKKSNKIVASEFYNVLMNILGSRMDNESKRAYYDKATKEHFSYLDIAGYNYGTIRYDNEPKLYKDRIIVGSETRPPNIAQNWSAVMRNKHVIGDFMWAGWDYLGEAGIGNVAYGTRSGSGLLLKEYPYLLAGSGVIDICGKLRPEVWLNKCVWGLLDGAPYIGVEPVSLAKEKPIKSMWRKSDAVHSWTWDGYEGYPAKIVVYAKADSVKLFLNSELIGVKKVKDYEAHFNTKFAKGELVAISYDESGKELGRDILKSAGTKIFIKIDKEEDIIKADGQDLMYLNIYLTDENDNVISAKDCKLQISIEGEGTLQGFGSAAPYTKEGFVYSEHETFFGAAQAIIRSTKKAGKVKVSVSGESLVTKEIEFTTITSSN